MGRKRKAESDVVEEEDEGKAVEVKRATPARKRSPAAVAAAAKSPVCGFQSCVYTRVFLIAHCL